MTYHFMVVPVILLLGAAGYALVKSAQVEFKAMFEKDDSNE